MSTNESTNNTTESSKIHFKRLKYSELQEVLKKNDNIIDVTVDMKKIKLPIIGIANCNM